MRQTYCDKWRLLVLCDMHSHVFRVAVLAGDYIGPEVMAATRPVVMKAAKIFGIPMELVDGVVGGAAIDCCEVALPDETLDVCASADAVLFGSVGGPKWEHLPAEKQPERAALLPLRRHFHLFANLRPVIVFPELIPNSPLCGYLQKDVDILVVRELTGGIYFATPKKLTDDHALDTLRYERREVERIAHVAFQAAMSRRRIVTSIDKANVLQSMLFWRKIVSAVGARYPQVKLQHMYVDNAAMQLVINPNQFDVLLCPNMFGDILSDEAAALPGSLGMLPSASLGSSTLGGQASGESSEADTARSFGLYEPAGGSAPDIAGKDIANPIAQILSAAMLFKYSVGRDDVSRAIYRAVHSVITKGARTADIAGEGDRVVGTAKMGALITDELRV